MGTLRVIACAVLVSCRQDARSHKQWYANTLLSRLDQKDEGSIIVVKQRLHPDDLVGHLFEQGGWRHLNLPAIAEEGTIVQLDATRRHLHPARDSQAALDELTAAMGSLEFNAQYQQAPVPIGGNLIKWSWFKFYERPPAAQPGDRLIVSWDTAMSSGQLADYSACVVLLVRRKRSLFSMSFGLALSILTSSALSCKRTNDGEMRARGRTNYLSRRRDRDLA
jgi:hypothetical protein